jgi:hypothetical protein
MRVHRSPRNPRRGVGPAALTSLGAGAVRVCSLSAGWKDEEKWLRAARALNLSREQVQKILVARQEMLATLQRCAAPGSQGCPGARRKRSRELPSQANGEICLRKARPDHVDGGMICGQIRCNTWVPLSCVAPAPFTTGAVLHFVPGPAQDLRGAQATQSAHRPGPAAAGV